MTKENRIVYDDSHGNCQYKAFIPHISSGNITKKKKMDGINPEAG